MSRRYRQRGYQDEERPRREPAGAPGGREEGPRGRGLGRPTNVVCRCARCGEAIAAGDEVAVEARCSRCGADLHTCTNCRHFDSSAPRECRLDVPVRIARKSVRNDCELFAVKQAVEADAGGRAGAPGDARAAFDALFKL